MNISKSALIDAAYDAGLDPDDDDVLRFDYSGRGMYGRECFGIVGGLEDLIRFVATWAAKCENEYEDHERFNDYDWLTDIRSDSMGLSSIWYWPSVQVVEEAVT